VTESAVKTAGVTVNVAEPRIVPDLAVMMAVPWTKLVANPVVLATVATAVAEELQVAVLVRFCVLPLL
jgi:hypothetical protein